MASKHVLLAEVFYQRQEDGSRKRYRTGDVVTGLSDEQVERLLKAKAIGSPSDLPAEPKPEADDESSSEVSSDKPAEGANKPELVAWVYDNLAKEDGSDYTKSELNKMSPDDLRDLIDSVDD